jgi:hypothetical protein
MLIKNKSGFVFINLVLMVMFAAACGGPQNTIITATPFAQPTIIVSPKALMKTATATTQPQNSPTPVTPASTPTIAPSMTPTFTPTALVYNRPGFYGNVGGCVTYDVGRGNIMVDFCVASVEVRRDGSMFFGVTWTVHNQGNYTVTKRSDLHNRNMYLRDNLGNRIDQADVGGGAGVVSGIEGGDTLITGWFLFPPPDPGAISFTFYDDDQRVSISGIVLFNPQIIKDDLVFEHYPFALEYRLQVWKLEKTSDGMNALTHLTIPGCQIIEWSPVEIIGLYKNTLTIGNIEYKIYGWTDSSNKQSVREYLAVNGFKFTNPDQQPFLHALIPFDNGTHCLTDIGEALATLHSSNSK